jgi:hypothetical protein
MVMRAVQDDGSSVRVICADVTADPQPAGSPGTELFRYVYQPPEPQIESPRPYFHPLRTLGGDLVSVYRPHDHVWHKGLSWSLPNVADANFWGGTTYQRGHGYRQLPNNGRIRHERFGSAAVRGGLLRLDQELSWVTEQGETWFRERRRIGAVAWPRDRAWVLAFETSMRNVSGASLSIGSPTTQGRDNAGYGGLFWRGPRSFTGGEVLTPDGAGGDECMGLSGPWMAFTGRHDGHGRASTVVFVDCPANFSYPSQWFVRSQPFACLCPAPFFSKEYLVADGESVTLRYDVAIADGGLSATACGALATMIGEGDVLAGSADAG